MRKKLPKIALTGPKKSSHHPRNCSYPGCSKRLVHIGEHLHKVHGVEKQSAEYFSLLRKVRPNKSSEDPMKSKTPENTHKDDYVPSFDLKFLAETDSSSDEEPELEVPVNQESELEDKLTVNPVPASPINDPKRERRPTNGQRKNCGKYRKPFRKNPKNFERI